MRNWPPPPPNGYFNAVKEVAYWSRKYNHITKEQQELAFEDVHIKLGKTRKDFLSGGRDNCLERIRFS